MFLRMRRLTVGGDVDRDATSSITSESVEGEPEELGDGEEARWVRSDKRVSVHCDGVCGFFASRASRIWVEVTSLEISVVSRAA